MFFKVLVINKNIAIFTVATSGLRLFNISETLGKKMLMEECNKDNVCMNTRRTPFVRNFEQEQLPMTN